MANYRTLSAFKTALAGGGARPNLFEVSLTSPPTFGGDVVWDSTQFSFLCKSAALPASNIAAIDVPFRGRILKVAGDRTIDPWTVTVINDENFTIRTALERWMNHISQLSNNTGATNPDSYMTTAEVFQLGRGVTKKESTQNYGGDDATIENAVPLKSYKFYGIFPTNISAIDLSYDSSDTIEEYTVEFQVQYWTAGETKDQAGASMI